MRRAFAVLVLSLLSASTVLTIGGSASAAASKGDEARSLHQKIVDYWTPERRANAKVRDVVLSSADADGTAAGEPATGNGNAYGHVVVKGHRWDETQAPVARTTGKAFFVLNGSQYVCSASAIANGQDVDLVLTAGHCVWDPSAGSATFFLFVPSYAGGGWAGYELWTARAVFTTTGWKESGALSDDAGLAVVTNGEGGSLSELADVLPTMATELDYSTLDETVHSAFGYPSKSPYKGATLGYCQGPVAFGPEASTVSMECKMAAGSSGGPWYSGPGGTGVITSLTSFGYSGVKRVFGPTFDAAESQMLAEAADGSCEVDEACSADLDPQP